MHVCVWSNILHQPCLVGPTNKKLRVHLPLITPGGGLARLRVGFETREACAGRAFVFDDSFEHEAWNDDGGEEGDDNNVMRDEAEFDRHYRSAFLFHSQCPLSAH